jgi:hypothetical protein
VLLSLTSVQVALATGVALGSAGIVLRLATVLGANFVVPSVRPTAVGTSIYTFRV